MKYTPEFEGLRGLLAIWVVVGHALGALPQLWRTVPAHLYNGVAVDVFIILSGYAIFSMLNSRSIPFARYISARALRLFPAYLAVLLITIVTLGWQLGVLQNSSPGVSSQLRIDIIRIAQENLQAHVLAHLFLLQGLVPESILSSAPLTLVGQAWSLSLEWQFYWLAPIYLYLIHTLEKNASRIIFVVITGALWYLNIKVYPGAFVGNALDLFGIGIFSYYVLSRCADKLNTSILSKIFIFSITMLIVLAPPRLPAYLIWITVLYSAMIAQKGNASLLSSTLRSSPCQFLGRISYSLYLIHMLALSAVTASANIWKISASAREIYIPGSTIILSVILGYVLYISIERPAHILARQIGNSERRHQLFGT